MVKELLLNLIESRRSKASWIEENNKHWMKEQQSKKQQKIRTKS